jgi:alpha/beta hydrolase fold
MIRDAVSTCGANTASGRNCRIEGTTSSIGAGANGRVLSRSNPACFQHGRLGRDLSGVENLPADSARRRVSFALRVCRRPSADAQAILWFHRHYRSSDADRHDFRYAPLICKDLSRLPPALIIVGECDPLRDDGTAYAERLQRDGNAVELTNYPGMVHPFFSMGGAVDAGRQAMSQATGTLKRAFSGRGVHHGGKS